MAKYTLKQKALATVGAGLLTLGMGGLAYITNSGCQKEKEINAITVSETVKEAKRLEDLIRDPTVSWKHKLTRQEFTESVNQYNTLVSNPQVMKEFGEYDDAISKVENRWPLSKVPFLYFMLFYVSVLSSFGFFAAALQPDKKIK